MGKGSVVGQAMLDSPDVQAITFTGSTATGKRVAVASVEHNRKYQLEMGGKNPFVVLDDADLTVAVEAAVNSAFFSTGQRCTASSRSSSPRASMTGSSPPWASGSRVSSSTTR